MSTFESIISRLSSKPALVSYFLCLGIEGLVIWCWPSLIQPIKSFRLWQTIFFLPPLIPTSLVLLVDEYFWESFQKGRFSSSLHKKVKKLNHEQKCILFMCVHTQHSPNYLDNQLKGIILKPSSQICIELIELGLLEPFTRGSNNVNINTQVQQILQKNSGWFSDIYPSIIKQDDIFPPPRKIH